MVYGEWIFAVNRDSTVSLWSVATGGHVADFSVLSGGEWTVISSDGRVLAASRGAAGSLFRYDE